MKQTCQGVRQTKARSLPLFTIVEDQCPHVARMRRRCHRWIFSAARSTSLQALLLHRASASWPSCGVISNAQPAEQTQCVLQATVGACAASRRCRSLWWPDNRRTEPRARGATERVNQQHARRYLTGRDSARQFLTTQWQTANMVGRIRQQSSGQAKGQSAASCVAAPQSSSSRTVSTLPLSAANMSAMLPSCEVACWSEC